MEAIIDTNIREKEKPKYNTWQNTCYVLKYTWERRKTVVFTMIAQSLLIPAIPAVAMFLPMMVVSLILGNAGADRLVLTILVFTGITLILSSIKRYLDCTALVQRASVRLTLGIDILFKVVDTDYANLENKKFTDAKQKAQNTSFSNSDSTEQIYYTLERLGANIVGFVVYIIILVNINPLILLITAVMSVLGFFVRRWSNKWQHDNDEEKAGYEKRFYQTTRAGDSSSLAKDIRLFSMINWLNDVHDTYMKLRMKWDRRAQIRDFIADATDCVATFLREGMAYAFLIWQILYNSMPVDQFILLFAAVGGFSGWIMGILSEYAGLQKHSLNYCRLREYYEYPDTFKRDDGESIAPEEGKDYSLELRNVTFRYPGADEDTLQNINLTVHPGEKLAIVGLNGAGKTTLVKLLCGFYDPTAGEVLLNGQDIRVYDRKKYYSMFTAVFQEFNIIPVSIAENIAQQNAEKLDSARVEKCLELANLTEKINSLPDGALSLLRKEVHDEAVELSGGETQRLMLARALYKNAPVLILDEPTAALDPIAESKLYEQYNKLSTGRTSVYISHRLASTRFCDRTILIDGKIIAETGTHDELLEANGKYAELFEIQSKYYREEVEI
ncbi:MAG: ABC transporter ATP-binding protein/permease [Oscillospiraceae bacterium]|nr:ABC transporter ATP-binding protein/permease [Oscillospiraceae bacterium]